MKTKILFTLFFLFQLSAFAQLEEARRITQTLCSEAYFGRGYVKSGDSLAAQFLAKEFQQRGLKKIKRSYLQPFSFDVNTFPGKMTVSIGEKQLVPAIDFLVDPNSGSSENSWNYKLVLGNTLLEASNLQDLVTDFREKKTFNSIVIDIRRLKGDSLKTVKSLASAFTELCDVMVLTDEKFTFSVGQEPMAHALIYVQGNAFSSDKKIHTSIENVFKKKHQANNVVAMLPAKKRTKRILVFSAHYDHLGGMGSETYFPGGNDNASGTSMLFTLAEYFKENPVPYNIVFIAFAGEEAGLIGSHHFVEHPLINLKRIKFLLNLDIMGSGEEGITVVNGTLFPKEFEALIAINEKEKLLKQIKKRGLAANSDHYWFTQKGVPAFFIYTMGDNKNYHDVLDTYEALSFNEYTDITKLIAEFVKTL